MPPLLLAPADAPDADVVPDERLDGTRLLEVIAAPLEEEPAPALALTACEVPAALEDDGLVDVAALLEEAPTLEPTDVTALSDELPALPEFAALPDVPPLLELLDGFTVTHAPSSHV